MIIKSTSATIAQSDWEMSKRGLQTAPLCFRGQLPGPPLRTKVACDARCEVQNAHRQTGNDVA
eukprot:2382243-Pleurochrysis_carterae.AAC.1